MKHITILFVAVFALNISSFAQSDCKYNGSESAIVAELSKRNTNTGIDKLNQEELKTIARYWVADCKCKKGVETIEEAKKLSNEAFLSRRPSSVLQGDGTFYDKDLSVFGDLEPPFTSFHPNWCLKGNNSTGGMTLESGTNCVQESSRLSELDGQLSAYAGQFFVAYCQCINGVPSKEYADNLVATMQSTHKSFDDFRGATPRLSTQPLTSCDVVPGSEYGNGSKPLERNFGNMLIGGEISDLAGGFIHEIAQFSNNPKIKNLSNEVGQIQEKYGELRGFNNQISGIFGVNPADNEAMQIYEVSQAIDIGVAVAKSLFGKTEEKQLTDEQKQVLKAIRASVKNLKVLFDEIAIIELSSNINSGYIEKLFKKEQEFEKYNAFTAVDRYMYFWYVTSWDTDRNIQDYNAEIQKIQKYTLNKLLSEIQFLKDKYTEIKHPPYVLNKNQAFSKAYDEIKLTKTLYFQHIGHNEIADYYLSSYIGLEDFKVEKTRDYIKRIIESQPKKSKTTVKITDDQITIKHLKGNGEIWDCYLIPLDQGEFEIKNEVILSINNFSLNPKDFESTITFNHCEENTYYPKISYFIESKDDPYLGTEMELSLNGLVRYNNYVNFDRINNPFFKDANKQITPYIENIINEEKAEVANKQEHLLSKGKQIFGGEDLQIKMHNGKFGFIDKKGNEVIPTQYDLVGDFSEGLSKVMNDNKYGYINPEGIEVIPLIFDDAWEFSEGLAGVSVNNKYGFINKKGDYIVPLQYGFVGDFSEGLAVVLYFSDYGYVDKTGKEVIPPKYNGAENFSEGLAVVKKGSKYGYINKRGEEVIHLKFKGARGFYKGLARVQKGTKWGCIDATGEIVIPFEYDWIDNFSEGKAQVKRKGEYFFIDKTGKRVD